MDPDFDPKQDTASLMKRWELALSLQSFKDKYSKGVSAGGRVGYKMPLENGSLSAGVSGSGYSVTSGGMRYKGRSFDEADLTYQQGNSTYGASFSPPSQGMPAYYGLRYKRQF